jgi:transcriptional regulator with XRE-family HTH domain
MSTTFKEDHARLNIPIVLTVIALPVFAFQVGTGGTYTIDYLKERGAKGYPFAHYVASDYLTVHVDRSPVQNLTHISNVLRSSVAELARTFDVSRQAIYDWKSGKTVAPSHASALADLAAACDIFLEEGIDGIPNLARRNIRDGKNMVELFREGHSAEAAAKSLVAVLRVEAAQRQRLAARLSTRGAVSRDLFTEAGAPAFHEEG